MELFEVQPVDALLVIDVQVDFLPGGRLPVAGGDEIIPGINAVAGKFTHVIFTVDHHPEKHESFASAHAGKQPLRDRFSGPYGDQPFWPDHCVQNTRGAQISPEIKIPHAELVLYKGVRQDTDNLSAFFDGDRQTPTGLAAFLRERRVHRVFLCGLALDVCVGFTAIDAAHIGFTSFILHDLTRPTNVPGLLSQVSKGFADAGVRECTSTFLRGSK